MSIFCDTLDEHIASYEKGILGSDEALYYSIKELLTILEDNQATPDGLKALQEYSSYDLKAVLYTYVQDLLDMGNLYEAEEVLEAFFPYLENPSWFQFLRVRLCNLKRGTQAETLLKELLKTELSLPLLFNILYFLRTNATPALFLQTAQKTLLLLEKKEDLQKLLELLIEYYYRLDQEALAKQASSFLKKVARNPFSKEEITSLEELLTKKIKKA